MRKARVTVLAGGFSPEREVSLASGANVAAQLRGSGHEATLVDLSLGPVNESTERQYCEGAIRNTPTSEELERLRARTDVFGIIKSSEVSDADVIFPVIHGAFGEDGHLQAVLDAAGLPYVGSGLLGQALAMNKDVSKHLFVQSGVPTAAWRRIARGGAGADIQRFPVVVKPAGAGSAIGVSICRDEMEFREGLARAFQFDSEVVVEDYIEGREFTVGMLADRVLAVGEIRSNATFFDYQAKYQAASTREIFPADLSGDIVSAAGEAARRAANALRIRHYCRTDFIVDQTGRLFVLEVNALPGMTSKSLYPQSAAAAGISFKEVCDQLCEMALADGAAGAH
jgi:D-alanine-D-alanine ligase